MKKGRKSPAKEIKKSVMKEKLESRSSDNSKPSVRVTKPCSKTNDSSSTSDKSCKQVAEKSSALTPDVGAEHPSKEKLSSTQTSLNDDCSSNKPQKKEGAIEGSKSEKCTEDKSPSKPDLIEEESTSDKDNSGEKSLKTLKKDGDTHTKDLTQDKKIKCSQEKSASEKNCLPKRAENSPKDVSSEKDRANGTSSSRSETIQETPQKSNSEKSTAEKNYSDQKSSEQAALTSKELLPKKDNSDQRSTKSIEVTAESSVSEKNSSAQKAPKSTKLDSEKTFSKKDVVSQRSDRLEITSSESVLEKDCSSQRIKSVPEDCSSRRLPKHSELTSEKSNVKDSVQKSSKSLESISAKSVDNGSSQNLNKPVSKKLEDGASAQRLTKSPELVVDNSASEKGCSGQKSPKRLETKSKESVVEKDCSDQRPPERIEFTSKESENECVDQRSLKSPKHLEYPPERLASEDCSGQQPLKQPVTTKELKMVLEKDCSGRRTPKRLELPPEKLVSEKDLTGNLSPNQTELSSENLVSQAECSSQKPSKRVKFSSDELISDKDCSSQRSSKRLKLTPEKSSSEKDCSNEKSLETDKEKVFPNQQESFKKLPQVLRTNDSPLDKNGAQRMSSNRRSSRIFDADKKCSADMHSSNTKSLQEREVHGDIPQNENASGKECSSEKSPRKFEVNEDNSEIETVRPKDLPIDIVSDNSQTDRIIPERKPIGVGGGLHEPEISMLKLDNMTSKKSGENLDINKEPPAKVIPESTDQMNLNKQSSESVELSKDLPIKTLPPPEEQAAVHETSAKKLEITEDTPVRDLSHSPIPPSVNLKASKDLLMKALSKAKEQNDANKLKDTKEPKTVKERKDIKEPKTTRGPRATKDPKDVKEKLPKTRRIRSEPKPKPPTERAPGRPGRGRKKKELTTPRTVHSTGTSNWQNQTENVSYISEGVAVYTDPATQYKYKWCDAEEKWLPWQEDGGQPDESANQQMSLYENEHYRWCTKTNQWIPKALETNAEQFETEYYRWDVSKNQWIPKNQISVNGVTHAFENGVRTYTDKDGAVFFWDTEKKAWFPKIDDDFMAKYQMNYGFIDNTTPTAGQQKEKQTKPPDKEVKEVVKTSAPAESGAGKRKATTEPPQWFDLDPKHNTKVYVSNLPLDITVEEFGELMSKCGMIMRDPQTQKPKLKLYTEPDGQIKGDGLCDYIKVESVDLALKLLDESTVRGSKIKVQRATFQMKGEYNPTLKPKRKKKEKEKIVKMKERLFDWRPEKMRGERSKHEKIVIIKNLFTPMLFEAEVQLIIDYQNNLREECSKCGSVSKVIIYDRHDDGVAQVNMGTPEEADLVVKMMNGRMFGKRQLTAEIWDGKSKYKVAETEKETTERINKWDKYLETAQDAKKDDGAQVATSDSA